MTTNANKHGLRKAATERRNRHAQRTPLPPKPGVVEAARRPIDDRETAEGGGTHPSVAVDASDSRSQSKAQAFGEKAVAAKWEVSTAIVAGAVELTATRGAETIVQAWRGGVWDYSVSFYAYGDRNTKPRNASGAAKLLVRSPEEAAAEAGKVAANKHFRKSEPKDITVKLENAKRSLPFDPELDADELIVGALAGQAVVWYNRLSRGTESAIVGRSGVRLTVLPDGQRVANFCCPATGYRSCLVTSILKVGRGRRATTKGSEQELVEVG